MALYPPQQFGYQQPGMAQNEVPKSKILFRFACRDVKKMDTLSQSDPMCVISLKSIATAGQWTEVGRTECIKNCKDPTFVETLTLDYLFEEVQELQLTVYDSDGGLGAGDLTRHDYIGRVETTVGNIVGAGSGKFDQPLLSKNGSKKTGCMVVTAEEIGEKTCDVTVHFRASGLDKKDWFGQSDPYVEISVQGADGQWVATHRTETIMKTLNPTWAPFTKSGAELCSGQLDRPIKLAVYDWDARGDNDLIGFTTTTVNTIATGAQTEFEMVNPKKMPGGKKAKKGYRNSGVVHVLSANLNEKGSASFLGYLTQGLQLNFSIGIDWTGSNGTPTSPQSLHFLNPTCPNSYETAIRAVGRVLRDYDADKLFPTLGFGGKLPNGQVSHAFSLTGDESNPYCAGIEGVVAAYKHMIGTVKLWGPTNFAPIINQVAGIASDSHQQQGNPHYYVLLMLTDGAITDMNDTVQAIVRSTHLPLSIVIMGIGEADFSNMSKLDGDEPGGLVDSLGNKAERDIVQFIKFNEFAHTPDRLAMEVLGEIPSQVVAYMAANPNALPPR